MSWRKAAESFGIICETQTVERKFTDERNIDSGGRVSELAVSGYGYRQYFF